MSPSFLDTLKSAIAAPQVQFNIFLIEYKPGAKAIFALIEGRDDPSFYRRFIALKLPNGHILRLVSCGNRAGVIRSIQAFRSRYGEDRRVIALIDKDHTDLLPGDSSLPYAHTFQTHPYSIENYVCDPVAVRRYCVEVLGVPDMEPACDQIRSQYEQGLKEFHSSALRCMAWIVAARRRGDNLHLNGIDTSKIFEVDDDLRGKMHISEADLYAYLEKVTGLNSPIHAVPVASVESVITELKTIDSKKWLRGKQEIWFTVNFINKVAVAVKTTGVRSGARVQITLNNAIDLLSARSDIPPELDAFLTTTFVGLG